VQADVIRVHHRRVVGRVLEPAMRTFRVVVGLMAVLMGPLTALPAAAHGYYGGRGYYGVRGYWVGPRVGVYVGGPLWWGVPYAYPPAYGYAPPPYVYMPPPVVSAPAPPVYIERADPVQPTAPSAATAAPPTAPAPTAAAPGVQWWYLCSSPRGAYPYVRECPGGWERVPAVPAGTVSPPGPQ